MPWTERLKGHNKNVPTINPSFPVPSNPSPTRTPLPQIGGILAPPSGVECRLDPDTHEYSTSHLYDYPSSNLISDVLNANLITPIFAVPSQVRDVYDGLVGSIRSATVETLSADASSIITLIEEQYTVSCGWGWLQCGGWG